MSSYLLPLTAPAAEIGAKAAGLARAHAAQARVPDGFAIAARAYDEAVRAAGGPWLVPPDDPLPALERAQAALAATPLVAGLSDQLAARAARLSGGARLSVRSSALGFEDAPGASAAGIFESRTAVAPTPAELADAVRAVWASVWQPAAYAYLHARGARPSEVRMAVLVHAYIEGQLGTLFTRDPSNPTSADLRVEVAAPWEPMSVRISRTDPDREPAYADLARTALALEAEAGGRALDLEWVRAAADGSLYILQQRPVTAFAPSAFPAAPPDDATWLLDAEHNPDPLSPAQEGLVARVAAGPGVRQCVLAGYLYTSREGATRPFRQWAPIDLPRAFAEELAPAMEAVLAPLESIDTPPALEAALDAYVRFYALYGALAASLGRGRAALAQVIRMDGVDPRLAQALVAGTPSETSARDQALWEHDLERFVARWGALAPAWEVACPTYAERPPPLPPPTGPSPEERRAAAAARARLVEREVLDALPRMTRRAVKQLLPTARALYALGELDDLYFARAQRLVRRALLARGPDPDIFFVPLGAPFDPAAAARARSEHERRRHLVAPLRFQGGRPDWGPAPAAGAIVRGLGTGGRARARVGDGPGQVRVVASVLPQTTAGLVGAAALVTDHGGLLSHAATQAREYGLPAVVGTRVATATLRPGDDVLVDADRGAVYRLGR